MTLLRLKYPVALLVLAALGACGQWQRVGDTPKPSGEREITDLFNPAALYTRLGRIVSSGQIGFVGSVAFVAGTGDSTGAIVAISLANRSFAFERSGGGYAARYRIEYEFDRVGAPPILISRDKSLLVGTFQETLRTDESIIEQQRVNLVPGAYTLSIRIRDITNATTGMATARVTAQTFVAGTTTAPILVYQVRGRASRNDSLPIVLNPRGTVSYGGDTLLVYIEANGMTKPTDLPVQVRDEHDSLVYHNTAHFTGNRKIEGVVLRIAPDSAPLGQLEILTGSDAALHSSADADRLVLSTGGDVAHRTRALVSFSAAWVVTNFDDLLSLLRYFGEDRRVDAMRHAKNTDRIALWQDFFHATDPDPATPENESLDRYFARISMANDRFHELGVAGWRTDRGEVFIILGDPDEAHDQSSQLQNAGRYFVWTYRQWAIDLYFQDVTGAGRFQLTPQSRSDFERIRLRVQRPNS